jgi:hypothetical protein
VRQRLEKFAENNSRFVEADQFFDNALGIQNDTHVIDALKHHQKHAEQMTYLSSAHCSDYGPIIFGTEDGSMLTILKHHETFFFVWELFDDDYATYIWKAEITPREAQILPEKMNLAFKNIAAEVQTIPPGTRHTYRSQEKGNTHFKIVSHSYHEDGTVDFSAWEKHLLEKLDAMMV